MYGSFEKHCGNVRPKRAIQHNCALKLREGAPNDSAGQERLFKRLMKQDEIQSK